VLCFEQLHSGWLIGIDQLAELHSFVDLVAVEEDWHSIRHQFL